jgi:hypothetical protein
MCSSGSNKKTETRTQNQTSTIRPADQETIDAYKRLIAGAETTAGTAWNPATSQQVAGFTPDQQAAFNQIRGGIASPYINEAAGYARAGAGDISGNIENYYNPYVDQVVDATQRDFDVQNQRQQSGIVGDARMRGSLGGDREAVAQALTAEAQSRVQSPIMANLRSQGYNTALSAAQNEAARSLQTSGIMGNLGQLAYTDTSALLGIGGQQQQNQQGVLDAASANAQAQSAYPFQTQQWLAGILGSATPNLGSTTNSSGTSTGTATGGSPNTWSQAIGAGLAIASMLASGGRVPHRAAGGGIGYVPQFNLNQGRFGLQPSAPVQMGGMNMGGGEKEKGFADHWREVNDTAKAVKGAAGGISKGADGLGKYLNSSTGPGGWNTTVDYGSPMANLSSGFGTSMSGFGDAMSGLSSSIAGLFNLATGGAVQYRAAGGGVDDNDPAGSYDAWQDPGPRGLNDPAGLYDAGPTPPSAPMPALVEIARERAANPLPPNTPLMPQGHDLPPITDVPVRQQSIGAPPGDGTVYAAPPPPTMGQGPLNPSGNQSAPPAPAPASQQGIFDRTLSWIRSDEGRDALMRAGAAMMIGSREGGKGTTGIHIGQGLQAGIEGVSAHRKSQREQQIEKAKLDLANRAQQLRESENTRAEALHPYQINQLKQQTETQRAAADLAKIIQVDPNKRIFDARTGQWVTPPDAGTDQYADIAAKEYAKDTPKLLTESIKTVDESRGIVRTIDEMKALSENMYAGALADQRLAVAKVARLLGLDVDTSRISSSEQFRAKMQDFVLAAASKLKPLSNADIEFVQKGLPDLARDPTAIGPMLDSLRRVAERNALIESYRQQYYAKGRRPDNAAIEEQVNKQIPPPGGASGAAPASASAAPSGSIAPSNAAQGTTQQRPAAPQISEADRQKLLAAPDGLVQYKGRVFMKNGTSLPEAPENSYKRGFFGSIGDLDGNPIPIIR